jgi:exopolysaccharide biosynthesis polyprenyl glycosylphosphotransferase
MKKSELLFNLASILSDFLMIMVAGVLAFYLRFALADIRPILYELSLAEYVRVLLMVTPILLILLALAGLYNLKGTRRISAELARIFLAVCSGLLVVVILFFFNQTVFPSRLIVLLSGILTIVLVSLGRMVMLYIQRRSLKRGVGLHRLAVIDPVEPHATVVTEMKHRPELGYKVLETIRFNNNVEEIIANLERVRAEVGLDELLLANPYLPKNVNERLLAFCRDYNIKFNFVPDMFETARTNVAVETISGVPVIVLKSTPLDGWGRFLKRLLDIVISAIALVISSPIFLLTAIAIKLTDKGPVFFHQKRAAGLGSFECYKFRSMYFEMSEGTASGDKLREEIEKQNSRKGPYVKIKNDPRVTPVGRIIRRTKIDELPQLWHILVGQMSLVGPRVHMVKEVDKFRNNYKKLFVLKPGATGLTQITQASEKPEISWEEEIKLDQFYIENWSLWLDLYIIYKTILILLGYRAKVDY